MLVVVVQAERVFSELRHLEPQHVEGLDVYSTVLWHLQSDVELSTLAQDVIEFDKLSPQVRASVMLMAMMISIIITNVNVYHENVAGPPNKQ